MRSTKSKKIATVTGVRPLQMQRGHDEAIVTRLIDAMSAFMAASAEEAALPAQRAA